MTAYSGSTDPVTVSADNQQVVAGIALTGARETLRLMALYDLVELINDSDAKSRVMAGRNTTETIQCPASGSVSVKGEEGPGGALILRFTYNDCEVLKAGESYTFNGQYLFFLSYPGYDFFSVYDLETTYDGVTRKQQFVYACKTGLVLCGIANVFREDGIQYLLMAGDTIDDGTSYEVSGRIHHEEFGYVDFESGISLVSCSADNFSDGTLIVTGASDDNDMLITFNGCGDYTITFEGVGSLND